MDREQLMRWIDMHRECVQGDSKAVLDRCQREVRRHAAEDAWLRAKAIVEREHRRWEGAFGFPASESFAGREVCHALAGRLRHEEPAVPAEQEEAWTDPSLWGAFSAEARETLRAWVHDLAREEEHRVWEAIVRFVDQRGRDLVREGRLSERLAWMGIPTYAETAVRVTEILAEDCEAHAHPGASHA